MKRSAITLGLVRFVGLALAVLMNVVAARLLGPDGFGSLAFLLSLVTLMSAVSSGGLTSLLTRDVASAATTGAAALPPSPALIWIVVTSVGLSAVFLVVSALELIPTASSAYAVTVVCGALVGLGLLSMLSGIWRGLGWPAAGDIPIAVVIPAVFLGAVLLLRVVVDKLSVMLFFTAYVGAIWIAATGSITFLRLHNRSSPSVRLSSEPLSRPWLRGFWPFLFLAVVGALTTQLGTLMVGVLAGEAPTAFYRVAERMALLVSLPLVVLNAVIAPAVVRSHAAGDNAALDDLVRRTRHLALAGAVPLGLVLIVFGDEIVGAVFGVDYVEGSRVPLIILVLGQWINVACGSVGLVLSMCGHERTVLREQALAVGIAVIVLPPVVMVADVTGAALVMAATLALWNFRLLGVMRRQMLSVVTTR